LLQVTLELSEDGSGIGAALVAAAAQQAKSSARPAVIAVKTDAKPSGASGKAPFQHA